MIQFQETFCISHVPSTIQIEKQQTCTNCQLIRWKPLETLFTILIAKDFLLRLDTGQSSQSIDFSTIFYEKLSIFASKLVYFGHKYTANC